MLASHVNSSTTCALCAFPTSTYALHKSYHAPSPPLSSPHHIHIPQKVLFSNPRLDLPTNNRRHCSKPINPPTHHNHYQPELPTANNQQQLIPPPQRPPHIPFIRQQDIPISHLPRLQRHPLRIHLRLDPATPRLYPHFPHRGQIRPRHRPPCTVAAPLPTLSAEGARTVQRDEIQILAPTNSGIRRCRGRGAGRVARERLYSRVAVWEEGSYKGCYGCGAEVWDSGCVVYD